MVYSLVRILASHLIWKDILNRCSMVQPVLYKSCCLLALSSSVYSWSSLHSLCRPSPLLSSTYTRGTTILRKNVPVVKKSLRDWPRLIQAHPLHLCPPTHFATRSETRFRLSASEPSYDGIKPLTPQAGYGVHGGQSLAPGGQGGNPPIGATQIQIVGGYHEAECFSMMMTSCTSLSNSNPGYRKIISDRKLGSRQLCPPRSRSFLSSGMPGTLVVSHKVMMPLFTCTCDPFGGDIFHRFRWRPPSN